MTRTRIFKKFHLDGHSFKAEDCHHGILINPSLPKRFNDTPNDRRPDSQNVWWLRPFIVTTTTNDLLGEPKAEESPQSRDQQKSWPADWPSGTRFDVRRLDGGAWDRSTTHGCFNDLEAALAKANSLVGATGYTEHMWGGDFVKFPLRKPSLDDGDSPRE